jgi:hypothetical protein
MDIIKYNHMEWICGRLCKQCLYEKIVQSNSAAFDYYYIFYYFSVVFVFKLIWFNKNRKRALVSIVEFFFYCKNVSFNSFVFEINWE